MQYELVRDDGGAEIRLRGRITADALGDSATEFTRALGEGAYRGRLFIDMAATDFLDSSGIGWVLEQHRQCLHAGDTLILHSIPPMVSRVMQLMNLHRAFHIAADPSSARMLAEQQPE